MLKRDIFGYRFPPYITLPTQGRVAAVQAAGRGPSPARSP